MGYSPGLGFIHSGKQLSFVYDIADLYRIEYAVPIAFQCVAEHKQQEENQNIPPKQRLQLEQRTRYAMRNIFKQHKLLKRIPKDIAHCLDIPVSTAELDPYAEDPARPSALWTPSTGVETALGNDVDPESTEETPPASPTSEVEEEET